MTARPDALDVARGGVVNASLDVVDTCMVGGRVFVSAEGLGACYAAVLRAVLAHLGELEAAGVEPDPGWLGRIAGHVDVLQLHAETVRALVAREELRALSRSGDVS